MAAACFVSASDDRLIINVRYRKEPCGCRESSVCRTHVSDYARHRLRDRAFESRRARAWCSSSSTSDSIAFGDCNRACNYWRMGAWHLRLAYYRLDLPTRRSSQFVAAVLPMERSSSLVCDGLVRTSSARGGCSRRFRSGWRHHTATLVLATFSSVVWAYLWSVG